MRTPSPPAPLPQRGEGRGDLLPSPLWGRGGTARRRGPHVLQVVGVRGSDREQSAKVTSIGAKMIEGTILRWRQGKRSDARHYSPTPSSQVEGLWRGDWFA